MKSVKIVCLCFYLLCGYTLSACGNKGPLFLPKEEKPIAEATISSEPSLVQEEGRKTKPRAAGLCPFRRMAEGLEPTTLMREQ